MPMWQENMVLISQAGWNDVVFLSCSCLVLLVSKFVQGAMRMVRAASSGDELDV